MTSETAGDAVITARATLSRITKRPYDISFALAVQSLPWCPTNPTRGRLDGDHQEHPAGTREVTEEDRGRPPRNWSQATGVGLEPELCPLLEGSRSGQCPGSPVPQREGEKVSMSQRGPTSRPPSRRRSPSQSTGAHVSPSTLQPVQTSGVESPREPASIPLLPGQEPPRQATPRSLGVHTILNPSDPREFQTGPSSAIQRPAEGGSSPSSAGTRQYGVSGSPYQAYGPGSFYGGPGGPSGPVTSVSPSIQQESPTPIRPFNPALGNARRMLTPRSPRPPSFSRVATPSSYADPQPPLGYPSPVLGRTGGQQDVPSYQGAPSNPSQQPVRSNPHAAASPASSAPRSFSQPAYSGVPHFQFPQESSQAGATRRSPQGMTPAYPQGQYGLPPGRASGYTPTSGPQGDANLSTAIMSALQTGSGGVRNADSQPHLTLQTNTGEHITVPLDVHQGSRQADEKRHRNAGASARFRARKKERDKDMRETLQRLESENRDVSRHNQELQAERDFYRNERNRLREIVLRTPEIRDHAERGPPSPRSVQSTASAGRATEGSFASAFPAVGGNPPAESPPSGTQQHPAPYSGELERPSRRRRTDPPAADFGTAPYPMRPAQQAPSSLPPIVTHGLQGFPAPIASAPPSARLPPLRFDQPTSSSPTATQASGPFGQPPPPPPPLQTQFPPYGRPMHEAGWATGPRDPREGQHRSPGPPGQ